MPADDVIKRKLGDGPHRLRPVARVAVSNERKRAVNHVSGCNHFLLRAEDDDVPERVGTTSKRKMQLVFLVMQDEVSIERCVREFRSVVAHLSEVPPHLYRIALQPAYLGLIFG